jgi:hypothetical protein
MTRLLPDLAALVVFAAAAAVWIAFLSCLV